MATRRGAWAVVLAAGDGTLGTAERLADALRRIRIQEERLEPDGTDGAAAIVLLSRKPAYLTDPEVHHA
jgi:hypothetical protein